MTYTVSSGTLNHTQLNPTYEHDADAVARHGGHHHADQQTFQLFIMPSRVAPNFGRAFANLSHFPTCRKVW